ncbi:MAG: NAD-dependent epimerase/dehydratase family protein [Burkholderia gladioli]
MPVKTYLVTGASGFIGCALVTGLRRRGHAVRRAGRNPRRNDTDIQLALPANMASWQAALDRVDGVFHLAWSTVPGSADHAPLTDLNTNVAGTIALLEALKSRPHIPLVTVSSGGTVYGTPDFTPISESHPLRPKGVYGASKVAAEHYALAYQRQFDLDVRIMRLSNPFGPGQNVNGQLGAATVFAWKALRQEEITIWGDGSVVRDFIYIDDTVDALIAMMGAPRQALAQCGSVLNIGSGKGVSLRHIVGTIECALDRRVKVRYQPARRFDVPTNVLDVSLAESVLGWRPRTAFADGMARLLDAFADTTSPQH